jgi:hypothetical protein
MIGGLTVLQIQMISLEKQGKGITFRGRALRFTVLRGNISYTKSISSTI